MNRNEVLEQLAPITRGNIRQVETSHRTRIVVTPDMVTLRPGSGGALVPLAPNGVKAVANYLGMPSSFAKNLQSDTWGKVATELLIRKERFNMLVDNGEAVDFADAARMPIMPAQRVLETIEASIRGTFYHRVTINPNQSATLEVVGETRQAVARGDMIRAGAMVSFSPIGTIMPSIQAFVLRLTCTNGATSNTVLREYHGHGGGGGGEGDDIWQWFRESIRSAYGAIGPIINRYQEMMRERIPANDRAAMLEAMIREARITGDDADAIRARAIDNPPRNTYDLMNLITWGVSHVIAQPERRQRAMDSIAAFTELTTHARTCPVCHTTR